MTGEGHDPHESARRRIDDEALSLTMIEAYLIKLDRAAPQTLAMLEFHDPGEETAAYLLTLGQLRRFGEAANSLLETANVS